MGVIIGVMEPQYTDEELEEMRQENERGVTVDGKHYTLYQATQRQRSFERKIRKQKKKLLLDEKLGDEEKLQTDRIRYQVLNQEYRRFSKATGQKLRHERLEVAGFGPKQANAAKKETDKKFQELLEKANNGDKIVMDDALEGIVAGKQYEEILPLREKLSDRATRRWYLAQDSRIPYLIDRSLSIEEQARQACELRNQNRTNARNLMRDQEKRRELDRTDPNKSFEELIADKMRRKGLTHEQAIADILETATKTRKSINKQLGLE